MVFINEPLDCLFLDIAMVTLFTQRLLLAEEKKNFFTTIRECWILLCSSPIYVHFLLNKRIILTLCQEQTFATILHFPKMEFHYLILNTLRRLMLMLFKFEVFETRS